MARISLLPLKEKTKGLWVSGPKEKTPANFLRRNRGTHLIREREIRSRNGTTADAAIAAAHSLTKFNDLRFQGATTVLYRNGISADTGYNGTPLEFSISEPRTATDAEYLFVSGGGKLRKVDTSGTVTQWGISPPSTGNWGASVGGAEEAESEVTVFDPQETTVVATTSTGNWQALGSSNGIVTLKTNTISPSQSMVCTITTSSFDDTSNEESGE